MDNLNEMGIHVTINQTPNEVEEVIPFQEDDAHNTYIPKHASDLHLAFLNANEIFMEFRSRFIGKCSPVHLFWGSFDLAVSRFSGEKAPLHPGGVPHLPDWVAQEAYSHEVYSCGFWPATRLFRLRLFTLIFIPNRRSSARCERKESNISTIKISANICFRTAKCKNPMIPLKWFWISFKRLMKPRQNWLNGIGKNWRNNFITCLQTSLMAKDERFEF